MKRIIAGLILSMMFGTLAWATLTNNTVSVVKNASATCPGGSGTCPSYQNSDITDSGGIVSTGTAVIQSTSIDADIVYNVKNSSFGALGNGIHNTDGTASTGTPTAFTSATAAFVVGDVGKVITITGAGAAGVDLTTTIAAYVSATAITLTTGVSTTVSGVDYTYGTDDTSAIQTAINAVGTNGGGTVFFPKGTYIINGSFQNSTHENAQLTLPSVPMNSTPPKQIKFKGAMFQQLTEGNNLNTVGSILLFTQIGTSGENGIATWGSVSFHSVQRSNILVQFQDITLRSVQNPAITLLNLGNANMIDISHVNFDPDFNTSVSGVNYNNLPQPTTSTSAALISPLDANHAFENIDHIEVLNFYNGVEMSDHATLDQSGIYMCVNGINVVGTSNHTIFLKYVSMEGDNYPIAFTGGTASIIAYGIDIEHYVGVGVGGWATTTDDFYDPSNYGYGLIKYFIYGLSQATVSGGQNLKLQSVYMPPWYFSTTGSIVNTASVGIDLPSAKTATAAAPLDISSGLVTDEVGADSGSTTRTVNTSQVFREVMPSYATGTTNPVMLFQGNSASAASSLSIGGGYSEAYALTDINFYLVAGTTTTTGTEFIDMTSTGLGIGKVTPGQLLDIEKSQSAADEGFIENASSGTSAAAGFYTENNTPIIGALTTYGSAYALGSSNLANRTAVQSTGGMTLVTDVGSASGGADTIIFKPGGYNQTPWGHMSSTLLSFDVPNDVNWTNISNITMNAINWQDAKNIAAQTVNWTNVTTLTAGTLQQFNQKSCSTGLTTDSSGNINGCVASDEALKTGIANLPYDPSLIMQLNPVTYKWKDNRDGFKVHTGFIAQQVAKTLPQAVVPAGGNYHGVDPNAVLSVVVKEEQEQRLKMDIFQKIIEGMIFFAICLWAFFYFRKI